MYCIVKYAEDSVWEHYWTDDPKDGCDRSQSMHSTNVGVKLGIQPEYATEKEAKIDLKRAREINPYAGYDICPIRQHS